MRLAHVRKIDYRSIVDNVALDVVRASPDIPRVALDIHPYQVMQSIPLTVDYTPVATEDYTRYPSTDVDSLPAPIDSGIYGSSLVG